VVTKKYAHSQGCRPVLYLSEEETQTLGIPPDHLWRVVRFEVTASGWISWLHEREWRCRDKFVMPEYTRAVLVKNLSEVEKLTKLIHENLESATEATRLGR
jgi:hypothetical protein